MGSAIAVLLILVVVFDLTQRTHSILRNFPVIGHLRYVLERVGPELRQYIVTDNDEERPFSRDQRRWVYASAKRQNNRFGFGTDNDLERSSNYLIIKHEAFPPLVDPAHSIENDERARAVRPTRGEGARCSLADARRRFGRRRSSTSPG